MSGQRPPFGLGKVDEFVDRWATDFVGTGAGVIHEIARGGFFDLAFAEINHAVKRHVAGFVAVEEQVAGLRARQVASDEVGVAKLQRLGVGELREGAAGEVGGLESAGRRRGRDRRRAE